MPPSVSLTGHTPINETAWHRDAPTVASWPRVVVVAVVVAGLVIAAREVSLRRAGIEPSIQAQPHLWAWLRNQLREAPKDAAVLVGSSRMAFGFDQDEWARVSGSSRPRMLAWAGACPRPMLNDLAGDDSFRGTVLVGVTPGLFFCNPEQPFPMRIENLITLSRNWGPADEIEQRCRFAVQPRLAIQTPEVVSLLPWLRDRITLPQRSGQIPGFQHVLFARKDKHGRTRMHRGFENQPGQARAVQRLWQTFNKRNLYPQVDPEPLLPPVVTDVEAIQKRGGRVVFVRFPSTDWYREHERVHFPRKQYWDRLIEETGCLGIHFEDHEELRDFDCPEWSHLTQEDAIRFTRRLYAIIHRAQ